MAMLIRKRYKNEKENWRLAFFFEFFFSDFSGQKFFPMYLFQEMITPLPASSRRIKHPPAHNWEQRRIKNLFPHAGRLIRIEK
jgi:hypothetical protein